MKKTIITTALFLCSIGVFAQSKDTTKLITIHQNELIQVYTNINKAVQKIDDNPVITNGQRNSIDSLLIPVMNFIQRRYQSTVADTMKKGGKR